jgi:hypothetical protein
MTIKLDTDVAYKDDTNGSIISKRSEYEKYKLRMKSVSDINNLKNELSEIKNDISSIKILLQEIKAIKNDNSSNRIR